MDCLVAPPARPVPLVLPTLPVLSWPSRARRTSHRRVRGSAARVAPAALARPGADARAARAAPAAELSLASTASDTLSLRCHWPNRSTVAPFPSATAGPCPGRQD